MPYEITVDLDKCTGCKACELGCSFHLRRHYNPEHSAIRIWMEDTEGHVDVEIINDPDIAVCDGCVGEPQGEQCEYYCKPNAVTVTAV